MSIATPTSHVYEKGELAERGRPISPMLPYAEMVDDYTFECFDGMLGQVVRSDGINARTMDIADVINRKNMLVHHLNGAAHHQLSLSYHMVRRRVNARHTGEFPAGFAQELDNRWDRRMAAKRFWSNEYYVTAMVRPVTTSQFANGLVHKLRSLWHGEHRMRLMGGADQQLINGITESLAQHLSVYNGRRLGMNGDEMEVLTFLGLLINGEARRLGRPVVNLAEYLPSGIIDPGVDTIYNHTGTRERFGAVVSIKPGGYPGGTWAGMYNALNNLPYELTVTHNIACLSHQKAAWMLYGRQHNDDEKMPNNWGMHTA